VRHSTREINAALLRMLVAKKCDVLCCARIAHFNLFTSLDMHNHKGKEMTQELQSLLNCKGKACVTAP
jgi:hypothetical protein